MRWPFSLFTRKQTDEDILALLGGGIETSSGIAVSEETALRVPAVAAAIRTISEAAASLDCMVVEIAADGTETPAPNHPAHALVASIANDWTSSFELIRSLVVDALIRNDGGLAWVNWTNDRPAEIIRYRPGIIGADDDQTGSGEPSYRINGRPVPRQQIVHVRGAFDKSPVTLAREAIGTALVMERHAGRLFGRGARPGGIIRTKKSIGDDGVKRMLAGWKAAHEGSDNSGKTAVLWDDAEWQQLTLNSVDAQFQQLRQFQLQEIARAFNIPASMLGDLSRATWSNSAEMQRQFLLLCLEPWLKALESAFRRALFLPDDRARYAVRFDRDDFSNVDLGARATAINSLIASRAINPNEAREWLGGLPPYEGGNEFANPNTGASQPETGVQSTPVSQPDEEADAA
jgi:HK97 family phage portal protein